MTKAGERLIEGSKEALAIAMGEQPAARITINGHAYVPEAAALRDAARRLYAWAMAEIVEEGCLGNREPGCPSCDTIHFFEMVEDEFGPLDETQKAPATP